MVLQFDHHHQLLFHDTQLLEYNYWNSIYFAILIEFDLAIDNIYKILVEFLGNLFTM